MRYPWKTVRHFCVVEIERSQDTLISRDDSIGSFNAIFDTRFTTQLTAL